MTAKWRPFTNQIKRPGDAAADRVYNVIDVRRQPHLRSQDIGRAQGKDRKRPVGSRETVDVPSMETVMPNASSFSAASMMRPCRTPWAAGLKMM